jgi:hypothetical protein
LILDDLFISKTYTVILHSVVARAVNSHCEFALLRKKAKAKRIRFASLRRKSRRVRFRFASLFGRPNSQNCEKIRRILAKNCTAFLLRKEEFLTIFRHFVGKKALKEQIFSKENIFKREN